MTELRNAFSRTKVAIEFTDSPSMAKQSFQDECDINQILKRWRKSGELTHLATVQPTYGDFTNATDYLTATLAVQQAQADFDSLSARIRARMQNDPGVLLDFIADPANEAEAIELGLLPKPASARPEPLPAESTAVSPPETPPEGGVISGGE